MNPLLLSSEARLRYYRAISLQAGEPSLSEKIKWLNEPMEWENLKAKEILIYYDTLLSLLAWPGNKKLFDLAKKKMLQFTAMTRNRLLKEPSLEQQLNGTRIPGSVLTGRFSYAISNWLVHEYTGQVMLHSSSANPETVRLFFQQLLPAAEYESVSAGERNLLQRINLLKGKNPVTAIAWLMDLFRKADLRYPAQEFLFNELQLFISWKPGGQDGYLHLPVKRIAFHRQAHPAPACKKMARRKLPAPTSLSPAQQQQLVNIARTTLVYLFRETDPFSFAAPQAVKWFELEKGIGIALYSMKPGHRLSLESYIGYLVFKNGIPVAYGGGWIFGERCQFGINILEPFRGAESALILCQLIRTYHQFFGVKRFVVKPYQFGHHNKEALRSGAFWFYYKQGFRPEKENLQQLAETEWKIKKEDKQYRSPDAVLKKLTGSDLILSLSANAVPVFDAAKLSLAVTAHINTHYQGNRKLAIQHCERQTKKDLGIRSLKDWNQHEKNSWTNWCLLAKACLNVNDWSQHEKKQFVQLIRSKDNKDELDFIQRLQQHRRCWKDLISKFG